MTASLPIVATCLTSSVQEQVPKRVTGVPSDILQPSTQWSDAIRFQETLRHLASLFAANFQECDIILSRIAQSPHSARYNWIVNVLAPYALAFCSMAVTKVFVCRYATGDGFVDTATAQKINKAGPLLLRENNA